MADRITNPVSPNVSGWLIIALGLTTLMFALAGCDNISGSLKGTVSANQRPIVEFTNVPADADTFPYAPVIHWKGRDPDGFVEEYRYADVIDSSALAEPQFYIDFIPDEAWTYTFSTADTVYLQTETGEVTEHIFYLQCRDDRGEYSDVIHRTFYRTNNPPRVPVVKWYTAPDTAYKNDEILRDTLYCLDQITDTWPGLGFIWKSSDPDDRDLYTIPLQYRYYLEKTPHDTMWKWVATGWSNRQDIQISGLETGHYVFTIWARDDGLEMSSRPASITFDVYRPTFDQTILLINTTREDAPQRPGSWDLTPGTPIGEMYLEYLSPYQDAEYLLYARSEGAQLWKSYLGRFRLVIWTSENQSHNAEPEAFEDILRDYVRIGGRLWVIGVLTRKNMITDQTARLAESLFSGPAGGVSIPQNPAEFVGAQSAVSDLPGLDIDTSRTGQIFRERFLVGGQLRYGIYPLLSGVDIISAGSGAETAYYFKSYTDTASGDVFDERATVATYADTIYYPPTPFDCIIKLQKKRVLEITRVMNTTRGDTGEVVNLRNNVGSATESIALISYESGEPWAVRDTVRVDYRFQPYSTFHLRPCAIRYERLSAREGPGFEVRYRVAITTFPLYYMDNSNRAVTRMFNSMLEWFFLPYAH